MGYVWVLGFVGKVIWAILFVGLALGMNIGPEYLVLLGCFLSMLALLLS